MKSKYLSVKEIQKLDRLAIERYGIPSLCLMENAGRAVAEAARLMVKRNSRPRVTVVCGLGNNAGDGFVIAWHLLNAGMKVSVFLIGKSSQLKADALVNYQILKKIKHPVKALGNVSPTFKRSVSSADLVIDAIFGVGLNRDIAEPIKSFIETINLSAKKVLAVDIPSGLNGDTGDVYGVCIKADRTVTFSFAKKGFAKASAKKYTGKIQIVDIGIPRALTRKV